MLRRGLAAFSVACACALVGAACDVFVGREAPALLRDAGSDTSEVVVEASTDAGALADATAAMDGGAATLDGGDATLGSGDATAPDDAEALDAPAPIALAIGPEASCGRVAIDFPDAESCEQAVEAGCAPDPYLGSGGPSFDLAYQPPVQVAACADAEIDQLYQHCISNGLTTLDACVAVLPAITGDACAECVFGANGPFQSDDDYPTYYYVNVPGCVALAEPCNPSCASDVAATRSCVAGSCAYKCEGYAASLDEIRACEAAAESCTCVNQAALSNACEAAIQEGGNRAPFCLGLSPAIQPVEMPPSLTATQLVTLMTLFCGNL
ncbi:MAG: hypothetical protein ACLP1X_03025 [Polyangiaceae bacterium]|jgi:hypothetical protein